MSTRSFLGVKWTGCGVNHPPSSGTKVKEVYRASYTSTPLLYLLDILQAELYLFDFHRYVVCFLLGNSPASEFYMPTFRNTLFHLHKQVGVHLPAYEDGTDRVLVFVILVMLTVC